MKTEKTKKHLFLKWLPAVGILILLAVLLVFGNIRLIRSHQTAEKNRMSEMVGLLRKANPELSEVELIRLVFGSEDTEKNRLEGEELLNRFGYDDFYYSEREDHLLTELLIFNLGVLLLALLCIAVLYLLHRRRIRKEVRELQLYFEELNKGSYDLKLSQTEEGELSLLQSDIFKVTQLLRTAAEESNQKSEELARWLADISHQLKTPIASIRINLDNLLDDPDMPPELRKQFMKECSMQLEWISSLVQTLLKLARIDAGAVELKQDEMDLLAVALEAKKKLGILSELADVGIIWEDEPGGKEIRPEELSPVRMTGDAGWQLEAISNIMKNCIEHSSAGDKVRLSIRDTSVFKELTIRDTGEGIPEEDLPHIFERFYRTKNAKRESVGIGLSLAASVIEAGGGRIMVKSEKGVGSTFVIRYLV